MFRIEEYKHFLLGLVTSKVYHNNKEISNELINALLMLDTPITKSVVIPMAKQTLYKKYSTLFDLSDKPKGVQLHKWMLYKYKYKFCKSCSITKSLEDFGKDTHTITATTFYCKTCVNMHSNKWKTENRKTVNAYQKVYYYKHIDKMREASRIYQSNNKDKTNANSAKKRAVKLRASPPWLTDEQLEDIKHFYAFAKQLEVETGLKYHVDHIIPLQGINVCGLHVPWNLQVLLAVDNIKKSNKHFENYNY